MSALQRIQHHHGAGQCMCTDHMLGMTVAPPGMMYPLYSSSAATLCGRPMGVTLCQRESSVAMAVMYGNEPRSLKSGRRPLPTTASNSACAFLCTSGYRTRARKKAPTKAFVCDIVEHGLPRTRQTTDRIRSS